MNENQTYSLVEKVLFPPKYLNNKKLALTLKDKTVLITGASYGIGEQLTYILAQEAATLILVGRTEDKLIKVKQKAEKTGVKVLVFSADLRNQTQLNELIDALENPSLKIDIFINNAGKSIRRSIYNSLDRFHDFTRTMEVNYYAPLKISLALIPKLAKNKGQIINVSSIAVLLLPYPRWSAYQASKSAFDTWFRSVTPELRAKGIAMSTIYLPLVRTRMIAPTEKYKGAPAMKPFHVAKIIGQLVNSRRSKWKPWWFIFPQIVTFLIQRPFEGYLNKRYIKKVENEEYDG